jgi:hypothetical protein
LEEPGLWRVIADHAVLVPDEESVVRGDGCAEGNAYQYVLDEFTLYAAIDIVPEQYGLASRAFLLQKQKRLRAETRRRSVLKPASAGVIYFFFFAGAFLVAFLAAFLVAFFIEKILPKR